jgi:hypothetical protein
MKRRQILKQLAIATTAAVFLPSCITDRKKLSVALNSLQVTADDEELVGLLADTIIPPTEKPGGRGVEAHLFTFIMVDDCVGVEDKQKFLAGLRTFDEASKTISGKTFSDSSVKERLAILKQIEKDTDGLNEDVKTFYKLSKRFIIRGYTASEHFLTEIKPYKLIPGPNFKGSVAVNPNQTLS